MRTFFICGMVLFSGALIALPILSAATFIGDAPTGMVLLEGYREEVYLYVPEHYDVKRTYPMIVSLPADSQSAKKHAESWATFARENSILVLVPTLKKQSGDVPYKTDTWLLQLKEDIVKRYHISEGRVYLVGHGENAHYAAYVGLNYPKEFSAVALLNGSWVGPYEMIARAEKSSNKQVPFFVSVEQARTDLLERTMQKAYELEKKGYLVYLEKTEPGENFFTRDFRKRLWEWLEGKAQNWVLQTRQAPKTFRQKFSRWVSNNFYAEPR